MEDIMKNLNQYLLTPVMIAVAIVIIGFLLEVFAGVSHATTALFLAVGGIYFFARMLTRSSQRS